jgi:subtilisin family serine protease
MPVRATGGSADFDTSMAEGIEFATDHGAHVINLSIGPIVGESALGPELYPQTEEALQYARDAGVVIAAASGNWSFPTCEFPSMSRNVICVSATDRNDLKAYYSDHPTNVDRYDPDGPGVEPGVVAPGGQGTFCEEGIVSTYLRSEESLCYEAGYDSLDGTSMASPHVAGLAALVYDRLAGVRNEANAERVIQAIIDGAVDLGAPGYDPIYGHGRIDALAAVSSVDPVTPEPTVATTSTRFTSESAAGGQYSDAVSVSALVAEASGAALKDAEVVFELTGETGSRSWTAATDGTGVATRRLDLDADPGSYVLTARYAGMEGAYTPSADVTGFLIESDDSSTQLQVQTTSSGRSLVTNVVDQDSGKGLAGRSVTFFDDDVEIGVATTNADGVARFSLPKKYRTGYQEFDAVFGGDGFYASSKDRAETG